MYNVYGKVVEEGAPALKAYGNGAGEYHEINEHAVFTQC